MIAGETLIGLGSSAQLSFVFAAGELVPMKYRALTNGYCYLWLIFPNSFGPPMAYAFQYQTKIGWRGMFYVLIAMNFLCVACWYLFYFPPNFEQKHGRGRKKQFVKDFDYIGTFLFSIGLLLFLMGLSWGGSLHPWVSAHVLSTIIIGILLLIGFFVYEIYAPLKE
jgi:MFS family permease